MTDIRHLGEGSHFLIEERNPPLSAGPIVFKIDVSSGVAKDFIWNMRTNEWTQTPALNAYRANRGDFDLREISENEARRLIAQKYR